MAKSKVKAPYLIVTVPFNVRLAEWSRITAVSKKEANDAFISASKRLKARGGGYVYLIQREGWVTIKRVLHHSRKKVRK